MSNSNMITKYKGDKMKSNIVLIGFMGTGKTTNGRRLAKKLNKEFIDTDTLLECKNMIKIEEIFKRYGEKYFRKLETKVIKDIYTLKNKIISTGGGSVLNSDNIEMLKENGVVFLLDCTIDSICYNLKNSYKKRPLLNKRNWELEVEELYNKRREIYESSADYIINVQGKKHWQIVNEIISVYNKHKF